MIHFGNVNIDKQGYYAITSRKEGNNGKRLHRLIWENHYHTKIPKNYHIHHIDGNKLNNNIWNLQCVKQSIHRSYHMRKNNPIESNEELKKIISKLAKKRYGEKNQNYIKSVPCGRELYELNYTGLTQKEIAKKYNCSLRTIESRISKYKKENNILKQAPKRKDLPDKSYFRYLYYILGISGNQIAKILNCSVRTVFNKINID